VTSSICRASSKECRICIEPLVATFPVGVDEDTVSAREHGLLRIINKWDRSGGRTERTRKTMAERLFATEKLGGRAVYRFHAVTVFLGICLVLYYRATHVPPGAGRAAWLGLLAAELWFAFYWVITQSVRWAPIRRRTFKDRLAARSPPIQPTRTLQYVLLLRDMDRVLYSTYISTFLIFNHLWKTTLLASQINPLHHETSRQKKAVAKLVMFSSRGPLCHKLPLRSRDDHRCHDGTKGRVGT
jgi:hypothetical protein